MAGLEELGQLLVHGAGEFRLSLRFGDCGLALFEKGIPSREVLTRNERVRFHHPRNGAQNRFFCGGFHWRIAAVLRHSRDGKAQGGQKQDPSATHRLHHDLFSLTLSTEISGRSISTIRRILGPLGAHSDEPTAHGRRILGFRWFESLRRRARIPARTRSVRLTFRGGRSPTFRCRPPQSCNWSQP